MTWKRLILMLLAALAVLAGILFLVLRPQVVAFGPDSAAGSVSRFTVLEITFSREMDPESVEELLEITPKTAGAFSWEGETLYFTPQDGWPAGAEVVVTLAPGAESALGLSMAAEASWSFKVAPVALAYLWPSDGSANIYMLDLDDGGTQQLTVSGGVISFGVAPDGLHLYYFAENTQGGTDLFVIDRFTGEASRLLTCQRATCAEVDVSPGGDWLTYLRNESEVWVLRLDGESEAQRISTAGQAAYFPVWATEGVLSYYDESALEYLVYDLDAGREIESWQNQAGELGDWSPRGDRFVAPEFFEVETDMLRGPTGERSNQEVDESELDPVWVVSSQLQLYAIGEWQPESLTNEEMAEDYAPAFSPDGTRLVFTRRYLDDERWTPGRQVYLLTVFSSSAIPRQLTDADDYEYSAICWHPDGDRLAAVRFNNTLLTEPPEIWLLELDGPATRLVINGYAPQWVP